MKDQGSIGPGPLGYALPSMLVAKKDFNKASASSSFHAPIAIITEDKAFKTPAPNSYNVHELFYLCNISIQESWNYLKLFKMFKLS